MHDLRLSVLDDELFVLPAVAVGGVAAWHEPVTDAAWRFDETDWCVRYFERGEDVRLVDVMPEDAEVGCPGC